MTEPEKPAAPAKAAPAPAPAPQQQAAQPAKSGPLSAAEQQQLATLLARQTAAAGGATGDPVRMKVEGDHTSLTYGGLTIGTEFTTVPAGMVAAMTEAAADAGVTITQES